MQDIVQAAQRLSARDENAFPAIFCPFLPSSVLSYNARCGLHGGALPTAVVVACLAPSLPARNSPSPGSSRYSPFGVAQARLALLWGLLEVAEQVPSDPRIGR